MTQQRKLRIANCGLRIGMTLMELLVAVSIVGIMASFAVPQYRRTIERSYWQSAQDLLYTIRAGEEVYWNQPGNATYINLTTAAPNWGDIYMDNPNVGNPVPATFWVTGANGTNFLATARRTGSGRCMSINKTLPLLFSSTEAGCTEDWTLP